MFVFTKVFSDIVILVLDAETKLFGGPDMIVEAGSTINLTCTVKHVPKPPEKVYWCNFLFCLFLRIM